MGATVLVVDDDEFIQDMVTIIMSREKHVATVASSLQEAMEALGQQKFDLVLSDLRLADGSGLQILSEVRKNHPSTHVILITGFPDVETVRAALRDGAFDYLIKPIIPAELIHVTNRALEHQQLVEERKMQGNRLEAVFRGVDDAIIVLDEEWRITQVNDAAIQILGLSPSAIHKLLRDAVSWLFPSVEPLLQQSQERGEGKRAVRMVSLNENGLNRILSCTAALFHDPLRHAMSTILVVRDESQLAMLDQESPIRQGWHRLVGSSRPMQEVYELIEKLAEVDSTVLITGETGTGKELVAHALHNASPRCHRPFIAVNCAALPAGLLESELFGHTKGAFTNATHDKIGRFKLADGGTIFLDEIGDLSLDAQVRLLRVLQEQIFEAVGSNRPIKVDVRVITATHRNLQARVQEGIFRQDLYYRLKVVEVKLPPLRERKVDLPLLIDHFLTKFSARMKRSVRAVNDEVLITLMEHDWPGNVRELEHVLEHAMVVARQPVLEWRNLPPELRTQPPPQTEKQQRPPVRRGRPLKGRHPDGEGPDRETILQTLAECRCQVQVAATKLGISRSTLWRRMKAMGLHPPETEETKD